MINISDHSHHSHHGNVAAKPRLRKIFTLRSLPNTSEARISKPWKMWNTICLFVFLHGAHHDGQFQFHTQIYLHCIFFVICSFVILLTCLDIFVGFSVLMQTPKQSS